MKGIITVIQYFFLPKSLEKAQLADDWANSSFIEDFAISPIHYVSWIFDVFLIVAFIGKITRGKSLLES